MTPVRLVLLRDKRTRKECWVRLTGPMPSLSNPPGPEETKDRKGRPATTTQAGDNPYRKPRPN